MPRDDYSAPIKSRIAKYGTRPVYLVVIGFDIGGGAPWRISSYGSNLTVNGTDVYQGTGCRVSGIQDSKPASTCSITVADSDRAVYNLFLLQGVQDVTVYRWWAPDGNTFTLPSSDLVEAFVGRIGNVFPGLRLRFDCRSDASVKRAPAFRAGAPVNNWISPVGKVIEWGRDKVTIEE